MKINLFRNITFRQFFSLYLLRFLIALGITIIILIFIVTFNTSGNYLISSLNASFINLVLMIAASFFSVATRFGFFDIFAYSGIHFIARFQSKDKREGKTFNGVYEYTKSKEAKRLDNKYVYLSYLFVGLIYLILTIILYIIYRANFA